MAGARRGAETVSFGSTDATSGSRDFLLNL